MAKISDRLAEGRTFSFEFFPPKTDDAQRNLEKTLRELEPLAPSFVSVTYGAGGSTRDKTREVIEHIHADTSMTAMAHLTLVGHTTTELSDILTGYAEFGIENILALGGDPLTDPEATVGDLTYASELVELVRDAGDFSVGVAAHPELHPRSPDRATDRRWLAEKLDQADFGITQFFFEPDYYLQMIDELEALGCDTPILPGIMPVTNVRSVARMADMSGATFPPSFLDRLHAADGDAGEVRRVGVDQATELGGALLDAGAPGLHFYTLNRSTATREIYQNLGLGPHGDQPAPAAQDES
jgi:methylenetetrahydrofolate reductase (NADPH)